MLDKENPKSRRGKRVKREPQTRPLIVSAARSRVTERIVMSAPTSRELRSYTRWAARLAGMEEDEALVLTLDRAVTDLLKKDELWQKELEEQRREGGATGTREAAPRPSGPPPVPAGRS